MNLEGKRLDLLKQDLGIWQILRILTGKLGLNIICGVPHQILKVQRRMEMGLYPARQRKLTFSIGDLVATVWIGGAEILLSNLKDLATNSGFSLNLPHCKKR